MAGQTTTIRPSITVLFEDLGKLQAAISDAPTPSLGSFAIEGLAAGASRPETSDGQIAFSLVDAGQRFDCIGIGAPAPGLDEMIRSSRAPDESMAGLQEHGAHLLCFAVADNTADGLRQTMQLFTLAAALRPYGALGVIHTPAAQCLQAEQLERIVQTAGADELTPVAVNIIPFYGEGCTWYATRGARELGGRNVCVYDADNSLSMETVNEVVYSLVGYLRSGARIAPGETMSLGGRDLQAMQLDATYAAYLQTDADDDILQVQPLAQAALPPGALGPAMAFLLVAASDGDIDRKEATTFIDGLQRLTAHPELAAVFTAAQAVLVNLSQLSALGPEAWAQELRQAAQAVYEHGGAEFHAAYREALLQLCEQVASASGGFMGLGKRISAEERQALHQVERLLAI